MYGQDFAEFGGGMYKPESFDPAQHWGKKLEHLSGLLRDYYFQNERIITADGGRELWLVENGHKRGKQSFYLVCVNVCCC